MARRRPPGSSEAATPREVAEALVKELDPGPTWSIESFVATESLRRDRPIQVVEMPSGIHVSGDITGELWPYADRDEIVVAPHLSLEEEQFVVVHEMGHVLLHHDRRVSLEEIASLFDALPRDLVEFRLRSFACKVGISYSATPESMSTLSRAEQEAEWFATILLARIDEQRRRITSRHGQLRGSTMIDRLARTFGYY